MRLHRRSRCQLRTLLIMWLGLAVSLSAALAQDEPTLGGAQPSRLDVNVQKLAQVVIPPQPRAARPLLNTQSLPGARQLPGSERLGLGPSFSTKQPPLSTKQPPVSTKLQPQEQLGTHQDLAQSPDPPPTKAPRQKPTAASPGPTSGRSPTPSLSVPTEPPLFPSGLVWLGALGGLTLIGVGLWLLSRARATYQELLRRADGKIGPAPSDTVNCSVFAPPRVGPRGKFKIQVYLHLLEDYKKVEREAEAIDSTSNRRAFETLTRPIARGALVDLLLFCDDLIIVEPTRQLRWEGRLASELFEVELQTDLTSDSIKAALHVHVNGIPVGRIDFKVYIKPDVRISDWLSGRMTASFSRAKHYAETHAASYKTAFVSYSRVDLDRVSYFAEGLQQNKIELLMDVTALEPGQEWEKELPAQIARADVFYLMWSDNAAKSKWVDKEARQAVQLYDGSDPHRPSIVPIASHRPFPKLPGYLEKFHFNSAWADMRTADRVPAFRRDG
jgi:TIR domain